MSKTTFFKIAFASAAAATVIAIGTAVGATSPETMTRAATTSWVLGLLSIGSYMIALAYPKEENGTVARSTNNTRRSS